MEFVEEVRDASCFCDCGHKLSSTMPDDMKSMKVEELTRSITAFDAAAFGKHSDRHSIWYCVHVFLLRTSFYIRLPRFRCLNEDCELSKKKISFILPPQALGCFGSAPFFPRTFFCKDLLFLITSLQHATPQHTVQASSDTIRAFHSMFSAFESKPDHSVMGSALHRFEKLIFDKISCTKLGLKSGDLNSDCFSCANVDSLDRTAEGDRPHQMVDGNFKLQHSAHPDRCRLPLNNSLFVPRKEAEDRTAVLDSITSPKLNQVSIVPPTFRQPSLVLFTVSFLVCNCNTERMWHLCFFQIWG